MGGLLWVCLVSYTDGRFGQPDMSRARQHARVRRVPLTCDLPVKGNKKGDHLVALAIGSVWRGALDRMPLREGDTLVCCGVVAAAPMRRHTSRLGEEWICRDRREHRVFSLLPSQGNPACSELQGLTR